jgi:Rhodopirellula transposase DDE domain
VISVDAKKKELVGRYAQAGKEWHPQGEPVEVSTYDFPGQADRKAIPYGVYDLTDNSTSCPTMTRIPFRPARSDIGAPINTGHQICRANAFSR